MYYCLINFRGGSRISRKGVHIYKVADFISVFLNISSYDIYKRRGCEEGGSSDPPEPHLDPPLNLRVPKLICTPGPVCTHDASRTNFL